MSSFLRHDPCPQCGSRDNLGVWDDGHKYCFGCSYFEGREGNSIEDVKNFLQQQEGNPQHHDSINLPYDSSRVLPEIALTWLRKYGLTNDEIYKQNNFSWSSYNETLIYSVFDPFGNLVMFQERYFGTANISRFNTVGLPEKTFHIIGSNNNCITVVEDVISAIKVGRHTSCLPLWGSNLSTNRIITLSNMYPNLNIWLDKDKQSYSIMGRQRAAPFFHRARSIISELDPKAYNSVSIVEFLAG